MKLKSILLSSLAVIAALFVACEQEESYEIPQISLGSTELTFDKAGASQTFTFTTNRAWKIESSSSWLAFSPESGEASDQPQTVTVTALANTSYDRTASFEVKTDYEYKTVAVSQAGTGSKSHGTGTADDPFSVTKALEVISALDADQETDKAYYVEGIISSIPDNSSAIASYGNANYYISDDGGTTLGEQLYIFQSYYLGNVKFTSTDQIKVGDKVIIYGKFVNYKGNTPETVGKGSSYIYSLNGEISDGGSSDYTTAESKTVAEFIEAANTSTYFKLKGTVSKFNSSYCSFDLTDATGTIYVYSVDNKSEWVDIIKNGGTVELAGKYEYYSNKSQHEVVHAYILSFEEGEGTDYSNAESKTVAEFIEAANTSTYYKLKGTVSKFNSNYCSFDLTDATGTIYVYSVDNKADWVDKIKDGGTVELAGLYLFYESKSQHEVVNAVILSFEEGEGGGGGDDDETYADPSGSGTEADPYNVAKALEVTTALAAYNKDDASTYVNAVVKGTIVGTPDINTEYGNATYYIQDNGYTAKLEVYRGYGLNGDKFTSASALKEGDVVVVSGTLVNYKGNTPEFTTGSKLISLNGESGGEGGGDDSGDTQDPKTVTVAEFLAAAESETQPYQLTGTIGGSINTTYGNFDLTDETGTVYVYGLTKTNLGYGASNDKSFASLGLEKGDIVTLIGYRGSYGDKDEVVYAYYVSHESGSGGGDDGGDDTGEYSSNVSWTLGSSAYDAEINVNGTSGVQGFKLGTSSKTGSVTIVLPKGTSKVSFYGVSWKAKAATMLVKAGDTELFTQDLAANDGASNNSPYTMTVTSSDYYTKTLSSALTEDTTITVTTTGTNTRIIVFGVKAE